MFDLDRFFWALQLKHAQEGQADDYEFQSLSGFLGLCNFT